ncbi:MAG: VOC family protein [Bacillota bacterium]|nr:VOC family protein [Bacillota bacterium]
MKSIIPEIYIENCKEALDFYKEVFGGEIKNLKLADGIEMFKGYEGKIIHAELHINELCTLYFVDVLDEPRKGFNMNLVLEMESEDEINKVYSALSNKGSVKFALQKTFWGAYHAVVTDCYDVTWGLNYSQK